MNKKSLQACLFFSLTATLFLVLVLPSLCVSEAQPSEKNESSRSTEIEIKYQYYTSSSGLVVSAPLLSLKRIWNKWMSVRAWGVVDALSAATRAVPNPMQTPDSAQQEAINGKWESDALSAATSWNLPTNHAEEVEAWSKTQVYNQKTALSADAVSGATLNEMRRELGLSWQGNYKNYSGDLEGSTSLEKDYLSRGMGLGLSGLHYENNFQWRLMYNLRRDEIRLQSSPWKKYKSKDQLALDRLTVSTSFTPSTSTILYNTVLLQSSRGMLTHPYKQVWMDGSPYLERLPTYRSAFALAFGIRQWIPQPLGDLALGTTYTFNRDSWKINGHNLDLSLYWQIKEGYLLIPRYRGYWQESSFFFKDVYTESDTLRSSKNQGYYTSDYQHGKLQSHLVETTFRLNPDQWVTGNRVAWTMRWVQVDLTLGRFLVLYNEDPKVRRLQGITYSGPLSAWIIRTGLKTEF